MNLFRNEEIPALTTLYSDEDSEAHMDIWFQQNIASLILFLQ